MSLATWQIERLPDGRLEVLLTDKTMTRASAGVCHSETPLRLIHEWVAAEGEKFDLVVDVDGREYVLLPHAAGAGE